MTIIGFGINFDTCRRTSPDLEGMQPAFAIIHFLSSFHLHQQTFQIFEKAFRIASRVSEEIVRFRVFPKYQSSSEIAERCSEIPEFFQSKKDCVQPSG